MLRELVEKIEKDVTTYNSDYQSDNELRAKITHWLLNNDFNYSLSDDLIRIMQQAKDEFLVTNNLDFQQILLESAPFYNEQHGFPFIDLFAGIGGFNLALSANGGSAKFACEWDKSAKVTYFNNYGKWPFGDINQFTNTNVEDIVINQSIPDHSILAAGFPCQPFSHAGVSARTALGLAHGFECETQGTLFHSIARIAFVKQPQIVFMENVKNIVSHNQGETFSIIRSTMENLGKEAENKHSYKFFYKLVNSETVVPQRRVRCYMVCVREDIYNEFGGFEFPEFEGEPLPLFQALENLTVAEIEEYTISDRLWQGHIHRTQRNLDRGTGFTAFAANLNKPSNTIVARYGKDGKECLIPQNERNPRKLTIQECSNLFGYPAGFWTPPSKTPAYKQFGNSVVVPVVQSIAEAIVTQYPITALFEQGML
ncbi:DNA (cytosine-5-)-methyltransferase [Catenovulum adriaticum]|uniref:Cytosine-specific methyltransferase n=1 Tax=Catenovulum adriaticum TaxID=2984846 RepID=A0ABY7AIV4_9ALTE|nr:DNA (cytosine-5-)-methyltransferase [Catenovulum sp. TS8]WAJ69523.1 DNA (cytosine-5-)-methyltransferase [Catenovulum sp. TS8]